MPGIKVTMEFGSGDFAWSESYYWLTTSTPSSPSLAAGPAASLAGARVPCLGNGASLNRIRLSLFPAARLTDDLLSPFIPTTSTWPLNIAGGYPLSTLQYTAARPWEALQLLCEDSIGRRKAVYMAGIPAGLVQQEPFDQQGIYWGGAPGFGPRLEAFQSILTSGSWGWLTQTNETFQPVYQSAGAPFGLTTNAAYPGMVGVQVTNPLVFTDPLHPRLRIKSLRRINVHLPGGNGTWSVGNILPPTPPATAPWTYFLLNSSLVQLTGYVGIGQVAAYFPSFATIAAIEAVQTTHRKRGVLLGAPRGRSRSRV